MTGAAVFAAWLAARAFAAPECAGAPEAELAAAIQDPARRERLVERSRDDLLNYFSYEAYARRDVRFCDGLAPLHSEKKGSVHHEDDVCRTKFYEYGYVEAIVRRSPGLFAACVADARWSGLSKEDAESICRLRAAELKKLEDSPTPAKIVAACARMTASADEKQKEKCPPYVRAFFGDDGDCVHAGARVNRVEAAHDVEQCRSFAAFARGKCGRHEICRALSGEAAVVAAERARAAAKALCAPEPGPARGGRKGP